MLHIIQMRGIVLQNSIVATTAQYRLHDVVMQKPCDIQNFGEHMMYQPDSKFILHRGQEVHDQVLQRPAKSVLDHKCTKTLPWPHLLIVLQCLQVDLIFVSQFAVLRALLKNVEIPF